MSRNRVEPNFSDVEFLEDTTTYGYRYSVGEYASDTNKWQTYARRPAGAVLLALLVFIIAVCYCTYIAYDLLLISLPEQLPYQDVYKAIKYGLFEISLIQLGVLALFYIFGTVLIWEGSRAGWTILLFSFIFSISSCFQVMISLFTQTGKLGLSEAAMIRFYVIYGSVALFHFLLMIYLFKSSMMSYYRVDGTGAVFRFIISVLVCVGFFYGERLVGSVSV